MPFEKVVYKDNLTLIGADNLNAIQDELIRIAADAKVAGERLATKAGLLRDTASGSIVRIVPDATIVELFGASVAVDPVQAGSGDPSSANVRPISGWDAVALWDDPVYGGTIRWNQLLSDAQAVGSYSKFGLTFAVVDKKMGFKVTGTYNYASGDRNAYIYRQTYPVSIIKDHVYCIACNSKYANVYCYGAQFSGNWIGYAPHDGSIIKATNSAVLNLALHFGENISNGTVFNEEILINLFDLTEMFGAEKANEIYNLDMQNPRGKGVAWFRSLFHDNYYEPDDSYTETCVSAVNGDSYRHVTIQLGQTVYGGTLDVAAGMMVVDRANIPSYSGETLPGEWISDRDVYTPGASPTIGAQVVYKLATPIELSLTPTQITTLQGTNTIWADAGNITVDYAADLKAYIDNKIAAAVAAMS